MWRTGRDQIPRRKSNIRRLYLQLAEHAYNINDTQEWYAANVIEVADDGLPHSGAMTDDDQIRIKYYAGTSSYCDSSSH